MSWGLTRCCASQSRLRRVCVAFVSFAWTPDIAGNLSSKNSMKISFELWPGAGNKKDILVMLHRMRTQRAAKSTLITGDALSL